MEAIALLSLIAVMSAISRNGESNNEEFIALFVAFAILIPFCICMFYIGKAIKTVLSGLSEEQMKEKKRKLAARAPVPMVNVINSSGDKADKLKGYMEVNVYDTDAVSEPNVTVEMATCDMHPRAHAIEQARVLGALEGDQSVSDEIENTKSNPDEDFDESDLSIEAEALIIQTDNHGNDSEELQEQSPQTLENTVGKVDQLDGEKDAITDQIRDDDEIP
eukprot:196059_1